MSTTPAAKKIPTESNREPIQETGLLTDVRRVSFAEVVGDD
jgi:hypothetical protein